MKTRYSVYWTVKNECGITQQRHEYLTAKSEQGIHDVLKRLSPKAENIYIGDRREVECR